MKVQIVNEVNKDFVIEALRSIAEVITYGDQHDSAFFEVADHCRKKARAAHISFIFDSLTDEVVAFPLYVEAIKFAFHEESMVRTAVRALTLNVYHVGDECVNKYVSSAPHADYFLSLIKFFQERNIGPESTSTIFSAVDEIEDNLYYFSDVISAGIPDVREDTDGQLFDAQIPLLLPFSVPWKHSYEFLEGKLNGHMPGHGFSHENQNPDNDNRSPKVLHGSLRVTIPNSYNSSETHLEDEVMQHNFNGSQSALREGLLSYVTSGDDVQVLGSLTMLATLLQTKELDESMLDALGILPQRKQHKKLLLCYNLNLLSFLDVCLLEFELIFLSISLVGIISC
ncbi:hypothetical protein Acr_01g0003460 [Actinidia rufa]|uniref:FPL domain-containing protein n=1 Tax=Actinidia rufa TaxID=165716 RepID=A0A7J0E4F8_9ERIC|nr:hypothetical protein Acr_01g0003460 [Actinidia rufa]